MKKRRGISLSYALIGGVGAIGVIVCIVASYIGYREFTAVLEKQYNDAAYEIADTALTLVDGDKVEEYLKTGKTDDAYWATEDKLNSLLKTMGANYIYVAGVDTKDYKTLTYVFDAYNEVLNPKPYQLGYVSPDINEKYVYCVKAVMTTGERVPVYAYSYSEKFGAHTTAGVAVRNSSGKIVAFLGVEKAMSVLDEARKSYVKSVFNATFFIVILFMAGDLWLLHKKLVIPIQIMTKETSEFVQDQQESIENNRLSQIKSRSEIGELASGILMMEKDIQEYIRNLTAVTAEKERIGAELNVATQIQADMLPRIFPPYPEKDQFDLYATMDPAKEVGGDFYDFFLVDDDHLAVVIGDVSGKGVPAALFMVISKTLIKNYATMQLPVDEIFYRVNNDLCEGNEAGLFTTAWIGIYDINTGKLEFADAGHETALRLQPDGTIEEIRPKKKSLVLAAMEGMRYGVNEAQLVPGDMLLIYTDGVPEATDAHNELYGMERLEKIVNLHRGGNPKQLLHEVKEDVDRFVGEAPQFDDITMLALEIRK